MSLSLALSCSLLSLSVSLFISIIFKKTPRCFFDIMHLVNLLWTGLLMTLNQRCPSARSFLVFCPKRCENSVISSRPATGTRRSIWVRNTRLSFKRDAKSNQQT